METKEYVKKRNMALIKMDKDELISLFNKNGIPVPEDDETFWAGIHKARMQVISMPKYCKKESKKWLMERGFSISI